MRLDISQVSWHEPITYSELFSFANFCLDWKEGCWMTAYCVYLHCGNTVASSIHLFNILEGQRYTLHCSTSLPPSQHHWITLSVTLTRQGLHRREGHAPLVVGNAWEIPRTDVTSYQKGCVAWIFIFSRILISAKLNNAWFSTIPPLLLNHVNHIAILIDKFFQY